MAARIPSHERPRAPAVVDGQLVLYEGGEWQPRYLRLVAQSSTPWLSRRLSRVAVGPLPLDSASEVRVTFSFKLAPSEVHALRPLRQAWRREDTVGDRRRAVADATPPGALRPSWLLPALFFTPKAGGWADLGVRRTLQARAITTGFVRPSRLEAHSALARTLTRWLSCVRRSCCVYVRSCTGRGRLVDTAV
jgi:hypothetical protein